MALQPSSTQASISYPYQASVFPTALGLFKHIWSNAEEKQILVITSSLFSLLWS